MGMLPVFAVYSTFLQRAFDQLMHDAAIAETHIVLGVDRSGVVGEDGETHQGLFDVPMLTSIPGIKIYSPASYAALTACLKAALYQDHGVVAIRYPRGKEPDVTGIPDTLTMTHIPGGHTLVITYGRIVAEVIKARGMLSGEGIESGLLCLTTIYPLDTEIFAIAEHYDNVIVLEESSEEGGIGEKIGAELLSRGWKGCFRFRAAEGFVRQATVERCLLRIGLTAPQIAELVKKTELADET